MYALKIQKISDSKSFFVFNLKTIFIKTGNNKIITKTLQ